MYSENSIEETMMRICASLCMCIQIFFSKYDVYVFVY